MMNTEIVQYLNFLTKQYDGVTQLIARRRKELSHRAFETQIPNASDTVAENQKARASEYFSEPQRQSAPLQEAK